MSAHFLHHPVRHPLGEEWLMAYAAGALSEGQSLLVASHLSYLDDTASRLAVAEAAGGALLEAVDPARMAPEALANTLARLDETRQETKAAPRAKDQTNDVLPPPLRAWLGRGVDELNWSLLGPGMKKVKLWRGGPNDQRLWMLRARPGIEIPMHGHSGTELVLVLKGSLEDEHGIFRAGDVEESNDDRIHSLRTGPEEECICLAVTEGPTRFQGWLARALQPLIGL
ncbi:anti-ECFsigma factor, ChrR [Parvibaculum lavamentivorans DS-1]|uniref:Anti-ECFsigma factor, ChrR n=1 Tax=Parvibaculum lavamentivorans (strain DS-1 / DSM 13023 / NCIMB 13966) TaxID=402881 RepID=A7HUA0_PARL1|nr:ChrR family anti-sigma-E factor [Parvibaculum lavamentivorans]ABS63483.1 anti-ECFsigma factor, ChrR [Parvibaculum lavamentivorans DS-1]